MFSYMSEWVLRWFLFSCVRIHILFRTIWIHVSPIPKRKKSIYFIVFELLCWEFYFLYIWKKKMEKWKRKKTNFFPSYVECHKRKIYNHDWCVFVSMNADEKKKRNLNSCFFSSFPPFVWSKIIWSSSGYIVTLNAWLGKQLDFNNWVSPPFKASFLSMRCTKFEWHCISISSSFCSLSLIRFVCIFQQYTSHPKHSRVSSFFLKFN